MTASFDLVALDLGNVLSLVDESVGARESARLSWRPEQSVDDRPENVDGAKRSGLEAVQFTGVAQLERDLKKLGVL